MKRLFSIGLLMLVVLFVIIDINNSLGDSNLADAISIKSEENPPIARSLGEDNIPANLPINPETDSPNVSDVKGQDKKSQDSAVKNGSNQPPSNYRIDVNITEQKTRVYDNNKLIKEWIVSTGKNNSTPLGRFTIQNRGEWFFSDKYQQGAQWWVSFKEWGVYLFHSIPMDQEKNIIADEAQKLGNPASHGCVRLNIDDAKWIYDNIPAGTPVYIHN